MEVQLWGGPRDGEVLSMPKPGQPRLFFMELAETPTMKLVAEETSTVPETRKVSYAAMGRMSRDGRMLYRYEGAV